MGSNSLGTISLGMTPILCTCTVTAYGWLPSTLTYAACGVRMEDAPAPAEEPLEQPLAGKTFVITGTLARMSREDAESAIEKRGGTVTGSISRKTSWLVVGRDAGSKLEKARAVGVSELDEAAFLALIMKSSDQ